MTCGMRNDGVDDHCPKGHDNWFEARDLALKNEWFFLMLKLTGLTPFELEKRFLSGEAIVIHNH